MAGLLVGDCGRVDQSERHWSTPWLLQFAHWSPPLKHDTGSSASVRVWVCAWMWLSEWGSNKCFECSVRNSLYTSQSVHVLAFLGFALISPRRYSSRVKRWHSLIDIHKISQTVLCCLWLLLLQHHNYCSSNSVVQITDFLFNKYEYTFLTFTVEKNIDWRRKWLCTLQYV